MSGGTLPEPAQTLWNAHGELLVERPSHRSVLVGTGLRNGPLTASISHEGLEKTGTTGGPRPDLVVSDGATFHPAPAQSGCEHIQTVVPPSSSGARDRHRMTPKIP